MTVVLAQRHSGPGIYLSIHLPGTVRFHPTKVRLRDFEHLWISAEDNLAWQWIRERGL
jgi:hypothetical protein